MKITTSSYGRTVKTDQRKGRKTKERRRRVTKRREGSIVSFQGTGRN